MKTNNIIRSIPLILLLVSITSCAVLGSKESLVTENESIWETDKTGNGDYYTYKCDNVSIIINEVVYNKQYHSFGFILPIIPSGVGSNFEDNNLTIETKIVGYVKKKVYKKEDFILSAFEDNKALSLTAQKLNYIREKEASRTNTLWGQYSNIYIFDKTLKDINSLVINIKLPFQSCVIPSLKLIRIKSSDNEFIIAPGA